MSKIIIFGGGGFAIEIIEYIKDLNDKKNTIVGIIDENKKNIDDLNKFYKKDLIHYKSIELAPINDHYYLIAIMDPDIRSRVFLKLHEKKVRFFNLIHPTAYVSNTSSLGNGIIICPFAYVGPNSIISDNVAINIFASIGHDASVGFSSFIGPKSSMLGNSRCEERVFIGHQSTISVGVSVGAQSKVSHNSTLTENCPPRSLASGVPAKHRVMFK